MYETMKSLKPLQLPEYISTVEQMNHKIYQMTRIERTCEYRYIRTNEQAILCSRINQSILRLLAEAHMENETTHGVQAKQYHCYDIESG